MNEPTNPQRVSPPWLLIIGVCLGVGLLVLMAWDSLFPPFAKNKAVGSAHVVEFTNANWQQEVLDSNVPVLVDFTAKWCGPCQNFAPTVSKLAERYQGKVKVGKFDVGDHGFNKATKLASQYGIRGVPQVMIFKGGELFAQYEGGRSETQLAKDLDRALQ
jgi:thioredoxin 1